MASYQDIFDGVQRLAEAGDLRGLNHFLDQARKESGIGCRPFRRQMRPASRIVANWPVYKRFGLTFKVAHEVAALLTQDGD